MTLIVLLRGMEMEGSSTVRRMESVEGLGRRSMGCVLKMKGEEEIQDSSTRRTSTPKEN
jgi:hypothetical protein